MAGTAVTREQFQILKGHVVHTRPEIATENLGRASDRLENGDDYSPKEVRTTATQLFARTKIRKQ